MKKMKRAMILVLALCLLAAPLEAFAEFAKKEGLSFFR